MFNHRKNALIFSKLMNKTKLENSKLRIGNFEIICTKSKIGKLIYNNANFELIKGNHDYQIVIQEGILNLSLQLYLNARYHYRLFAFTEFNGIKGMAFSINLTTEIESEGIVYLTQQLKFTEQYSGDKTLAKSYRLQKQTLFIGYLRKLGFDITENNYIILGIFDPIKEKLVNTTPEDFLNDFILISILKAHFQGNKGFQLEILPTFSFISGEPNSDKDLDVNIPEKLINQKRNRSISFGLRYKILNRDNFKCCKCGRNADDGIKLHVDHKVPFSLGGTSEISNLWTLCNECNLGKSNKYIDP